jgi:hypothetical protein
MPASAVIMTFGLRVIDAGGQARGGETPEHDRMHRADAHRRQHREHRLGIIGM